MSDISDRLRFRLRRLLRDIALAGQRAPAQEVNFGPPCSYLISEGFEKGVDEIIDWMVSPKTVREFPINGAGLKLVWGTNFPSSLAPEDLYFVITGDQDGSYPVTVGRIKEIIKEHGFERE
jgi:hypothetical protein